MALNKYEFLLIQKIILISFQPSLVIKTIFSCLIDAPTCKPNQTRIHGVAKQEKANISCQVDANPSDVSFRWSFNNSAESIDVASAHISKIGTSSTVSYTPMTEMDYGTLLCWARNIIGDQRVPCVFHIIAAGNYSLIFISRSLLNIP